MDKANKYSATWEDAPMTNEGKYRVFGFQASPNDMPKVWMAERQDADEDDGTRRYEPLKEDTIMRLYRGSHGKIQQEAEALAGDLTFDRDPAYPWIYGKTRL